MDFTNTIDTEYDYLFKIIVIGDSGIGKSSILFRFADDIYNDNYISTIGVDFKIKTIYINGKMIKLQIWDTAGQERFRTITTSYYRGAHIIFLCYDITDRQTFLNLDMWNNEIKKFSNPNVKVVLCGTKMDLIYYRQVSREEGHSYADKYGYEFYETSAKNNKNIDELFEKTSERLLNDFMININNKNNENNLEEIKLTQKLGINVEKKNILNNNCC